MAGVHKIRMEKCRTRIKCIWKVVDGLAEGILLIANCNSISLFKGEICLELISLCGYGWLWEVCKSIFQTKRLQCKGLISGNHY